MIGETFEVNGKKYTLQSKMTMGEYEDLSEISLKVSEVSKELGNPDEYEKLSDEELLKIGEKSVEYSRINHEHLKLISNFLERVLGLTFEERRALPLDEAVTVFYKAFQLSASVKKKSKEL